MLPPVTDVLVLDEPTAGMNQSETAEVQQQLLDLKASGQTMLLFEHKLDLVMSLSDRVIVMDEGRIVERGRHDDLLAAGGRYAEMWQIYREAHAREQITEVLR